MKIKQTIAIGASLLGILAFTSAGMVGGGDDDDVPGNANETGIDEVTILVGRDANGDDLLDSFRWQVPSLAPGTYFIFATISNPNEGDTHVSIAQGTIIVRDPANP